jgi:hypothetical protein
MIRMRRSPPSRNRKPPRAWIERKIQIQPELTTRDFPPAPSLDQDQGTTPTEMEKIVSTASCKTTCKKIVLI